MSTIFISHSTLDKTIALQVLERLRKQGYEALFLDSDPEAGIKAGSDWERDLYRNLKLAAAVVVLCSPDSMASRWCFAEIAQAKALGKALFPVVIRPCEVVGSLTDRQVIDMAGRGEEEGFQRLFDGLRAAGLDPADSFGWDQRRPPFPGFLYFDQEDAGIYFGREVEVRQVIEKLTQMQRQGEPRLFVLVGSSGSGKSSLARAGVLPRLHKDPSRWAVVEPFRPKTDPVGELARSLSLAFPEGPARPDWKGVRDRLGTEAREAKPGDVGNENPANSVLSEYSDDLTMALGRREASVLVVVDQAEELLQGAAPQESAEFLTLLRNATSRPGGRVFGLLTLRSDFLGSFQNHLALRGVVFADMLLGLLPVEDFPQVIEGPAARAEIALEPGLVTSLIADARTDDALPLLAFTLREMYERCHDQARFTLKVYCDDLGRIEGVVARVVERIKAEGNWTPETSHALRRAFLKLARVNDEGQFTRQPARWADLPDQAAPVLEAFVKARLLTSDGDMVEVTHECLFRVWPELADWLDEGRELMLWKKNIRDEVRDWTAHDRSSLYLLSGARVAEARRWLAASAEEFSGPDVEFITASIAAEDDRVAKLRRNARILVVGVVFASVLALIASGTGIYAFIERNEANTKARIATSRQLAAVSASEPNNRLDRSLILAVEALGIADTDEARKSLFGALSARPGLSCSLHNTEGFAKTLAFSPDGKTLAVGHGVPRAGGGVELWDVARHSKLAEMPLAGTKGSVLSVAFSPDGETLAGACSVNDRSALLLWDVTRKQKLVEMPLPIAAGDLMRVAFSPDGKTLAVGCIGGVVLWDVSRREWSLAGPLAVTESVVGGVAFSPDGKHLGAAYKGEQGVCGVVVWQVPSRKRLADLPLAISDSLIQSVVFSPDSKILTAGYGVPNAGGGVVLWELARGQRLTEQPLRVAEGEVMSVVFTPDGNALAAGYGGRGGVGGVVLYDAAQPKRLSDKPLSTGEGYVESVAFSPDGKTLAVAHDGPGGAVELWGARRRLAVGEGAVTSVAFSPHGDILAAAYSSGAVLWDATRRERLPGKLLTVAGDDVSGVTFSPDGKMLAARYSRGMVLWDVGRREQLVDAPLPVTEGLGKSVAFSPDGKTLVVGYDGGSLLWDVGYRKWLDDQRLSAAGGDVLHVVFSPDGIKLAAACKLNDRSAILLWKVAKRERLVEKPVPPSGGEVTSIAFSPDGETLAVGCRRWSAAVGRGPPGMDDR